MFTDDPPPIWRNRFSGGALSLAGSTVLHLLRRSIRLGVYQTPARLQQRYLSYALEAHKPSLALPTRPIKGKSLIHFWRQ